MYDMRSSFIYDSTVLIKAIKSNYHSLIHRTFIAKHDEIIYSNVNRKISTPPSSDTSLSRHYALVFIKNIVT